MVCAASEGSGLVGMSTYTGDESVLRARAKQAKVADDVIQGIIDAGIKDLSGLAFCSAYTPGSTDEAPLLAFLKDAIGRDPTLAEGASFRRLFHESYAVVAQELRTIVERTGDDAEVRKLTNVERAERHKKQQDRLVGLSIRGINEPSDALVDLACAQFDANRLSYIAWEKCTSRTDEQEHDMKKNPLLTIDGSSGQLRLERKAPEKVADVGSEIKIQGALLRRALAYDQANLVSYEVLAKWNDKLMKARLTDPPQGYARVSFQQMERADRRLFSEVCDETRQGVQPDTGGKPADAALRTFMVDPEVLQQLQPLPQGKAGDMAVRDDPRGADVRYQPYGAQDKGKGKKGKGKDRFTRMPLQLIGCKSHTQKGEPICYSFNLNNCTGKVERGRCPKGLHICCAPGCGQVHAAVGCSKLPKKSDG